ncbi:MAG: DUF92 domain-containing protein [archaeon]
MILNPIKFALPLFIALFGLESRSLTMRGAFSAIFLSYILIIRQNFSWFLILFSFYIIGTVVTKIKSKEKEKSELMQKTRGPWNVMGNAGIGLIFALLGGPIGFIGFIGTTATATADTISSEIGVLSKSKPRLVTTLKKVEPGTDGGITLFGTVAGALGALIIGLVSTIEFSWLIIPIALMSGIIGNLADSFIGAVLEDKETVGNSTTNFLATTSGAISAMLIYLAVVIF